MKDEIAAKTITARTIKAIFKKYADQFQPVKLITIDELGGWQAAQRNTLLIKEPLIRFYNYFN